MDKFFFKPCVGAYYDTGLINGIKVMILGASHYCLYNEKSTEFKCPNWAECTSRENRDSSKYNTCCPWNHYFYTIYKTGIIICSNTRFKEEFIHLLILKKITTNTAKIMDLFV